MRARRILRWTLAAVAAALLFAAGRALPVKDGLLALLRWIGGLGPEAYVLYAAVYVVVTVLLLPAWLMTIGAGLVFGMWPGVAVVWVGATAGAAASFSIARHLARDRVARYASGSARFAALDRAVAKKGWRIVFLLRLSPVVPYVFSNYLYGLTAIRFWPYVAASGIGMIPLIILYVSFGAAARQASVPEMEPPVGPWKYGLIAAGLILTAAATWYAARIARRELAEGARRASGGPSESAEAP